MSGKSNEFTREYIFNNPLMSPVMCRPNCCLFCGECTDIFYDLHGPYGIACLKGGDFESGMLGKCKEFKEGGEVGWRG
jgi:hypothetical protein